MKLIEAIGTLGLDEYLVVSGSDGSWYYRLGKDKWGDLNIIDQDGEPVGFQLCDLRNDDWLVLSEKQLKKFKKR